MFDKFDEVAFIRFDKDKNITDKKWVYRKGNSIIMEDMKEDASEICKGLRSQFVPILLGYETTGPHMYNLFMDCNDKSIMPYRYYEDGQTLAIEKAFRDIEAINKTAIPVFDRGAPETASFVFERTGYGPYVVNISPELAVEIYKRTDLSISFCKGRTYDIITLYNNGNLLMEKDVPLKMGPTVQRFMTELHVDEFLGKQTENQVVVVVTAGPDAQCVGLMSMADDQKITDAQGVNKEFVAYLKAKRNFAMLEIKEMTGEEESGPPGFLSTKVKEKEKLSSAVFSDEDFPDEPDYPYIDVRNISLTTEPQEPPKTSTVYEVSSSFCIDGEILGGERQIGSSIEEALNKIKFNTVFDLLDITTNGNKDFDKVFGSQEDRQIEQSVMLAFAQHKKQEELEP